ncbi:MAG: hypothetical protein ACE5G2_00675 [Candidatus Krumholzibacteriia bacterium]
MRSYRSTIVILALLLATAASCELRETATSQDVGGASEEVLEAAALRTEVERAIRALRDVAEGRREALTEFEHQVLVLKALRDALAAGGAERIEGAPTGTGAVLTLGLVQRYFLPSSRKHLLTFQEADELLQEGEMTEEIRDAYLVQAIMGSVRKAACFAYDRNTGEIVCVNSCSGGGRPRVAGCTPNPGSPCRVVHPGFKKCNDGCLRWMQVEIADPLDAGVVYVICWDGDGRPLGCPASGGRAWKAASSPGPCGTS